MRDIAKKVFSTFRAITYVICLAIISLGFHATGACADDVEHGRYGNNNLETIAQFGIAPRFNIEVEDIDCDSIFSKPSFGKAYHKSGSVQDYCRAIKPDVLPDYQVLRTGYQNGSEHPEWSIGALGILCFLFFVLLLIIWGGSIFLTNSVKPDFKHCNEI